MMYKGSLAEKRRMVRDTKVAYAFMIPALLFFMVFVLYPMANVVFTSFFKWTMKDFDFIGLDNYIELAKDPVFIKSFINTIIIVVGSVPITMAFSLFVSAVVYERSAFIRSFFRVVFYLPVVTGTVAVTVVWKWIYDPLAGILNWILTSVGIIDSNIMWTGDKKYALISIMIILLTTSVGQPIILYIAALGNVDKSNVEAAQVDGANNFQVFWRVKWPALLPTTLYVAVFTTVNSFQIFSLIQLLTSGGPNYSTTTLMYYLYEKAFKLSQYGYANTIGVVLIVVIGAFSVMQFKLLGDDVEY